MVSTPSHVGTGNIVGVSTAICLGGPGACLFRCLSGYNFRQFCFLFIRQSFLIAGLFLDMQTIYSVFEIFSDVVIYRSLFYMQDFGNFTSLYIPPKTTILNHILIFVLLFFRFEIIRLIVLYLSDCFPFFYPFCFCSIVPSYIIIVNI